MPKTNSRVAGVVEGPLMRGVVIGRRRKRIQVNGGGEKVLVSYRVSCGVQVYEVVQWDPSEAELLRVSDDTVEIPLQVSARNSQRGPLVNFAVRQDDTGEEF